MRSISATDPFSGAASSPQHNSGYSYQLGRWAAALVTALALIALLADDGTIATTLGRLSGTRLAQIATIIVGTLISEDLTLITTALLMRENQVDVAAGLVGCFLGVFVGDVGLWGLGHLLSYELAHLRWTRRWFPTEKILRWGAWLEGHAWGTVFAARFIPGARLPTFVAAGFVGRHASRFVPPLLAANLIWTPVLIGSVYFGGELIVAPLREGLGWRGGALIVTVLLLIGALRLVLLAPSERGRAQLIAAVSRLWRWEFWPAWLFYAPLAPWIAYLAWRHGGWTTPTAANPAIPSGGVVGESKFAILARLPAGAVVPAAILAAGSVAERLLRMDEVMSTQGWSFPIILKPDVGQRGAGLRLVRDLDQARAHLARHPAAMIMQVYHHGPFEAGIFYYRMPMANGARSPGRIFSITDKVFPSALGDGESTLERLIWRHPRLRMQANTFLARLGSGARRVPARGERVPLAVAGNHCQGTLFLDGSHLHTPALEQAIERIAQAYDGFYFGRFDVRYASPERFRRGEDFQIVELNGVTSESTNIYDPSWSLWRAYAQLFRQWAILFEIGSRNRRLGHRATPLGTLWREVRAYYQQRQVDLLAD